MKKSKLTKKELLKKNVNVNEVTKKDVEDILDLLGSVLGLANEPQESSMNYFVAEFSNMRLTEAEQLLQNAILNPDYIEDFVAFNYKDMAVHFPHRSEEEVYEKLYSVESIRVAVAIALIENSMPEDEQEDLLDTIIKYTIENGLLDAFYRIAAVATYIYS